MLGASTCARRRKHPACCDGPFDECSCHCWTECWGQHSNCHADTHDSLPFPLCASQDKSPGSFCVSAPANGGSRSFLLDTKYKDGILRNVPLQVQSKLQAARGKLDEIRHMEPASPSSASASGSCPATASKPFTAHVTTMLGNVAHASHLAGTSRNSAELRRAPLQQPHCRAKASIPVAAGTIDRNLCKAVVCKAIC